MRGSQLNAIAGSELQRPRVRVFVWNPNQGPTKIGDVVCGRATQKPLELTHFLISAKTNDNVGFENANDPSVPSISFEFKASSTATGVSFRRGFIEDGVIVRVYRYDDRVNPNEGVCIFTGHFRGTPGIDSGTRADKSDGFTAIAYGREQMYVEAPDVLTEARPAGTDMGEIVFQIATVHMGLTQDEILIGSLGFVTLAQTNQIKGIKPLQALWECTFPAGKKPKFDGLGRLVAVDFDLEKPAARIYSNGDLPIRSLRHAPNEIEVNNSVSVLGLDHNLGKVTQEDQFLREIMTTIGFFESSFKERYTFSDDGSQRAENTRLRTKTHVTFSRARYAQDDEFSGTLRIDTHYLAAVREIIFASYLAIQLSIASIDLFFQEATSTVGQIIVTLEDSVTGGSSTAALAATRFALQIASQVTLAFLLWAMQFIGRGRFQIWGTPFETAYKQLQSRIQIDGLLPEEVREVEIRNDFISSMDDLDRVARERLRREMVKNQTVQFEMIDDPELEVDDVIVTARGNRYYVLTIERSYAPNAPFMMTVTAWKVYDAAVAAILRALGAAVAA